MRIGLMKFFKSSLLTITPPEEDAFLFSFSLNCTLSISLVSVYIHVFIEKYLYRFFYFFMILSLSFSLCIFIFEWSFYFISPCVYYSSKLADRSQGRPEGSLFNIYSTDVKDGGHYSFPWISPHTLDLYFIMLRKQASRTIF